jgi:hypothetical protein
MFLEENRFLVGAGGARRPQHSSSPHERRLGYLNTLLLHTNGVYLNTLLLHTNVFNNILRVLLLG